MTNHAMLSDAEGLMQDMDVLVSCQMRGIQHVDIFAFLH